MLNSGRPNISDTGSMFSVISSLQFETRAMPNLWCFAV